MKKADHRLSSPFNLVYETESQQGNITSRPPSPLRVLEGEPLPLAWTFSVVTTFLRVALVNKLPLALLDASPESRIIPRVFHGHVSASSTL